MTDPLRQAEARLQRFWNIDGLNEIAAALIFALTALWVWAADLSPLPHAWKHAFDVTFALMLCGGIAAQRPIVKALRRRLTYPRAGYVEYRPPARKPQVISALIAAAIAAALAIEAVRGKVNLGDRWFVPVLAVFVGLFCWQIGWRSHLPRFLILAGVFAAAGIAIAWTGTPYQEGMVALWTVAAVATLVSGSVTLWRFLHTAPAPVEE